MKIKKWTLALSGLALLSSCTTNGPSGDSSFPGSSSEGDFSSSSSEAPSSESAPESFSEASSQSQAEAISDKVYAVLEGMKAGNYSLSYVLNGKELTDIVTPSYCYTGYLEPHDKFDTKCTPLAYKPFHECTPSAKRPYIGTN